MKYHNLFLLSVALNLSACTFHSYNMGVKSKDDIGSSDREAIRKKCIKLFETLKANDTTYIRSEIASAAQKYFNNCGEIATAFNARFPETQVNDMRVEGEYLVTNSPVSNINSVTSSKFHNNYTFVFNPITEKTFVYMYKVPSKIKGLTLLVSCVFANEKDDWKLTAIRVGDYSINQKTAPDFYAEALSQYQQGNHFGALFLMNAVAATARPADASLAYSNDKEMNDFYQKLITEVKSKYPMPIHVKEGNFDILDINASVERGFYPSIVYQSHYPLKDKDKVIAEAKSLNKIIDKYLPEINKTADTIVYSATNSYLSGQSMAQHAEIYVQSNDVRTTTTQGISN